MTITTAQISIETARLPSRVTPKTRQTTDALWPGLPAVTRLGGFSPTRKSALPRSSVRLEQREEPRITRIARIKQNKGRRGFVSFIRVIRAIRGLTFWSTAV